MRMVFVHHQHFYQQVFIACIQQTGADADFFINKINAENISEKYSLCEINASCVSPFPESSIRYIIEGVNEKINS